MQQPVGGGAGRDAGTSGIARGLVGREANAFPFNGTVAGAPGLQQRRGGGMAGSLSGGGWSDEAERSLHGYGGLGGAMSPQPPEELIMRLVVSILLICS